MKTQDRSPAPRNRAAVTAAGLWTTGMALLLALAAVRVQSNPVQPVISVQPDPNGSNLLFQVSTVSNWFYTFLQSTNFTNWNYAAHFYASSNSLSWTNSIASNDVGRYFRVAVNPPNPAVLTNYHSWNNSISVNNGIVEAVVVPTIGRLQQFRFVGDTNNAFWEDSTLYGQSPSTSSYKGWGSDKAWPAPQNSWSPTWPPSDFDRKTNSASFSNGIVTMVSQVDSRFGIRTTRTIELLFNQPVMRVRTVFERTVTPSPSSLLTSNIAVWIDCQVCVTNSSRCYVPVPSPSIFANGYTLTGDAYFGPSLPPSYTQVNGLISFGPDTAATHKVGFDSGTLALVGTNISLRVEAPRVPGATYTAGGCSTEVWTGTYPGTPYFELELLSPAPTLAVGQSREFIVTYSLFRRTETTTDAEAQKVLSWRY
jgi:hypothetical protein